VGKRAVRQHEHRLTADLKGDWGVQANKIGSLALNVVPRGGLLWNPVARFSMKALYAARSALPVSTKRADSPRAAGEPQSGPEKVGTLDLQASYQSNRAQVSVDYFHSRETQLIFQDGSVRPALYYNLGAPATFQGIDSEGKYYVGGTGSS